MFVICVHVMRMRGGQAVRSGFKFVGSLACDACDVSNSRVQVRVANEVSRLQRYLHDPEVLRIQVTIEEAVLLVMRVM